MYECLNNQCPNYAGNGVRLGIPHVYADPQNFLHCIYCGSYVREVPQNTNEATARGVAGAAGGALLGFAIGGPPGALIGGIFGAILGSSAGSTKR